MALAKETKDLIYNVQMNQKISIYMAIFSNFGMILLTGLLLMYYNGVFKSIVPVCVLDFLIMMYFFRTFVSTKKHEYAKLYIFEKLKQFRTYVRR